MPDCLFAQIGGHTPTLLPRPATARAPPDQPPSPQFKESAANEGLGNQTAPSHQIPADMGQLIYTNYIASLRQLPTTYLWPVPRVLAYAVQALRGRCRMFFEVIA